MWLDVAGYWGRGLLKVLSALDVALLGGGQQWNVQDRLTYKESVNMCK